MDTLKTYASNTLAACGNQTVAVSGDPREIESGMTFLKVFRGGNHKYKFAFSAVLDSTFADGRVSRCNDVCPPWTVHSLKAAVVKECSPEAAEKADFVPVTFDGKKSAVISEDIRFTDAAELNAEKGDYICLVTEYSGEKVPCHAESIIALYRKLDGEWKLSPTFPVPVFTGIEYAAKKRVAFIGDSITQGIGSTFNSYRHYAAKTAELIGEEYAYWDMGIGYARGYDASTDGVWLQKAKQNDVVSVCFGVNDMFQGFTAEQVMQSISTIIEKLKAAGSKVLIQTVPPFDYDEHYNAMWQSINDFIVNEAAPKADAFFDNRKILSADGDKSPKAKYGGHPNDEGHGLWAQALAPVLKKLIEE